MIKGDWSKPDLLNLSMLSKELFQVFSGGIERDIADKYSSFTSLFQLERR